MLDVHRFFIQAGLHHRLCFFEVIQSSLRQTHGQDKTSWCNCKTWARWWDFARCWSGVRCICYILLGLANARICSLIISFVVSWRLPCLFSRFCVLCMTIHVISIEWYRGDPIARSIFECTEPNSDPFATPGYSQTSRCRNMLDLIGLVMFFEKPHICTVGSESA